MRSIWATAMGRHSSRHQRLRRAKPVSVRSGSLQRLAEPSSMPARRPRGLAAVAAVGALLGLTAALLSPVTSLLPFVVAWRSSPRIYPDELIAASTGVVITAFLAASRGRRVALVFAVPYSLGVASALLTASPFPHSWWMTIAGHLATAVISAVAGGPPALLMTSLWHTRFWRQADHVSNASEGGNVLDVPGRRCWGIRNWRRCQRRGEWRFYCYDHRYQPLQALLVAFTLLAGIASIQSAWFPELKEHATGTLNAIFAHWNTPVARGDRLSIYVASFGGDDLGTMARDRIIASIRSELGPNRVEVLPAGIRLALTPGVSDDSASDRATSEARSLLREKHGDLLIWGSVYAVPGMKPQLDLRFVTAESTRSRNEAFGLTDRLMLDPNFGPEVGAALIAVAGALAAPVFRDTGRYMASMLTPAANRLRPLTQNIPASLRLNDRALLLLSYGHIQAAIGKQSGESAPLEEAVVAYRHASEGTREHDPLLWAAAQTSLGGALLELGERDVGAARLEEAIAAHRAALQVYTRERAPLDWAATQMRLGAALLSLGFRESSTVRLEEAVTTFRMAMQECTRERMPLYWATAQHNLGVALTSLGERETGSARFEEAVAAIHEALHEQARERVPLDWALSQTSLGYALMSWGERESGTARLEEAVAAHRAALQVYSRDRMPLAWANTQTALGFALVKLGERETGTARFEEAVAVLRAALQEHTRVRAPLKWAMTQNCLGGALAHLGEREGGTARLKEAVAAFRGALQVLETDASLSRYRILTQTGLDNTTRLLRARLGQPD